VTNVIVLLSFYQIVWWILRLMLVPVGYLVPKLRPQLADRTLNMRQLEVWQQLRKEKARAAFFLCSSAGEYEQAKPLADRLIHRHEAFVLFIFISASGIRFAQSQQEKLPYLKAPWDQPLAWARLFRMLKPDLCFIVRYELWPGFLALAQHWAPVYLIDAVQSATLTHSAGGRWLWRRLLTHVRHVFAVGPGDQVFYRETLGVSPGKISLVGDSKYDRVLERLGEREERRLSLRENLDAFLSGKRVIILGSAWPKDLEALLSVYPQMRQEDSDLRLIVAPHDVSASMAESMELALKAQGLSVCRSSVHGLAAASERDDALLVDQIGLLPELYACAHLAWIGGAMHFRVHNVLEPACRGIYVCFGPYYQTSQEAIWLVKEGLAQVIRDGASFRSWYRGLSWSAQPPHQPLWRAVQSQKGASDRILAAVLLGGV
jgi:3-deoxy-D-manno-octulosonic-acid transferase